MFEMCTNALIDSQILCSSICESKTKSLNNFGHPVSVSRPKPKTFCRLKTKVIVVGVKIKFSD